MNGRVQELVGKLEQAERDTLVRGQRYFLDSRDPLIRVVHLSRELVAELKTENARQEDDNGRADDS